MLHKRKDSFRPSLLVVDSFHQLLTPAQSLFSQFKSGSETEQMLFLLGSVSFICLFCFFFTHRSHGLGSFERLLLFRSSMWEVSY